MSLGDFDALARSVARDGLSRRAVLATAGRWVAGAALSSPVWGFPEAADAKIRRRRKRHNCKPGIASCGGSCCSPGEICVKKGTHHVCKCVAPHHKCGTHCVNASNDPKNCGACGHACASGQVCSNGTCLGGGVGGGSPCGSGMTDCAGACVTLASDPHNCGACGNACANGTVCSGGACVSSCPSAETQCGAACVTLATDPQNCGGCGHVCASGQTCSGGACQGATSCDAPKTLCAGACVDLNSDASNCGTCGTVCGQSNGSGSPGGNACLNGVCGCNSDADCTQPGGCSGQCVAGSHGSFCQYPNTCSTATCTNNSYVGPGTCANASLGQGFGCQIPAARDCGPCKCDPAMGCNCACNQPGGCSSLGTGCFLNTCCVGGIGATCNTNWPGQGGCCGAADCGAPPGGGLGKCCLPFEGFGCSTNADCCAPFTCHSNGQCF